MASDTTTQTDDRPMPASHARGGSLWSDARRRLLRDKAVLVCLAVISVYVLIGLGCGIYEVVAEYNKAVPSFKDTADYTRTNQPPSAESWKYWLGTDWGGKSVLLKTLLGVKVSLAVGFMTNLIAVPLGIMLGAIAGFYRGRADAVIVWMYSTLASIPGFILLISLKYAFKGKTLLGIDLGGIHGIYVALGVTSWIGTCRLVRAEVMKIRELDYVLAARAVGTRRFMILIRHIVPNVLHLGIINFSLGFVSAIKAEVILSYLGLGVKVGTPSWGSMINAARMDLFIGRWWELTAAVTAMFFLVLALNIFGDRLRDALDPKLKNV